MNFWTKILASIVAQPARLRAATGWRRMGMAILSGGVMSFSMPPFNAFPLLFICIPALIFLLQGTANGRQAFAVGWGFAFGFLTFSLYWIAAAMFVDLRYFWWAVPLSVFGLPALFALYYGIAMLAARKTGVGGVTGAVTVGLLWFAADYTRGHFLTGFPWNLLGYSWSGVLPVLQITSVVGIYGLTLMTCIAAALPAALADRSKAARNACLFGLALFIVCAIGGEARLQTTQVGTVPDVRLRLVQPDVAQQTKWMIGKREEDFDRLLELTSAPPKNPGDKPPTQVIWPETASTFYLSEDAFHRERIAEHIPAAGAVITGVIRRDLDPDGATRFYNSLVVVDGLGRLIGGYDKAHLVPFGEYMPLRKYVPLRTLAASANDFTSGPGPRSLRVLGLPLFSPLICYEAIFPGAVIDRADRPDFMINITNDGWYGKTIGPYQHFAIARVRAIEEGLPLVRAANTGISGTIDPLGRVVARLGLGKQGFIDSDLPTPLFLTFYGKWDDIPVLVAFMLILSGTMIVKATRKMKRKQGG